MYPCINPKSLFSLKLKTWGSSKFSSVAPFHVKTSPSFSPDKSLVFEIDFTASFKLAFGVKAIANKVGKSLGSTPLIT